MWNKSIQKHFKGLVLTAGLVVFFTATNAAAVDPDFSNVSDILGGQQHLLRNDDLVIGVGSVSGNTSTFENFVLQTKDLEISNQTTETVVSADCEVSPPPLQTRVGRLFNLPNDVIVTLAPRSTATGSDCGGSPNMAFYIKDTLTSGNNSVTDLTIDAFRVKLALADFNRDGYQDILLLNSQFAVVYTAVDIDDPAKGVMEAGQLSLGSESAPYGDPVTGDFNGDGTLDAAWLGQPGGIWTVFFASVCPAPNTDVLGQTCSQAFEIILSQQTIDVGQFGTNKIAFVTLAAGDYDGVHIGSTGLSTSELVVARNFSGQGNNPVSDLAAYTFDATFTPTQRSTMQLSGSSGFPLRPYLATGKLDWSGPQDQLVFTNVLLKGEFQFPIQVNVITFDENLAMTPHPFDIQNSEEGLMPIGLALGRFDPPETGGSQVDFDLQIAVLIEVAGSDTLPTLLQLFTVDPANDFTPTLTSTHPIANEALFPFDPKSGVFLDTFGNPLQAGDLQGRSLRLGAVEKATITSHIQPDTVLGMPPMHVDWIMPVGGSAPTVLNVSVFPQTFNSQYDFAQTAGTQASRTSTTSYTYGFKESAEEKISYGVPDVASISVSAKQAASQTHQNTVTKNFNTYAGESFKLTAKTVFDDLVAATIRQMNIYSYPVIGQCVKCSADDSACAEPQGSCPAGERPLMVQFSGPDQVTHVEFGNGRVLEWYQPVHEPGNVWSYPGSLDQLKADQPQQTTPAGGTTTRLQLLSPDDNVWESQATETVSIEWTEGQGSDVKSGTVSNHLFNTSVSVAGNVNIDGLGLSAKASLGYNSSRSVSTVNSSTSTFSESKGVLVSRGIPGGPSNNPEYAYEGRTFIYGQLAPDGKIDDDISTDTKVQSQGLMSVGFVADPLSTVGIQSGDWWKQAYSSNPDVALNHPTRWQYNKSTGPINPQQVLFYCPVGFTSSFAEPACSPTQQAPSPNIVAGNVFYQMKGLFVTPSDTTDGPQIYMATVGDTVNLRARVYNYSLANMPADTKVRVQFYAQPWHSGAFMSGNGNHGFAPAVFIGEDILAPIPAFCGGVSGDADPCIGEDAPRNWVFANTQWDTSKLTANTYWKFWVVAWMQNNDELVPEIEGHGLTAIPEAGLDSLADVPIEAYSNNLGFYNQAFHLKQAEEPAQAAFVDTAALPNEEEELAGTVFVDTEVISPASPVLLDEPLILRAHHLATGSHVDDVTVLFYDGDPDEEGELFDMEIIPHIQADDIFVTSVPFQPRSCGLHTIYVQAIPGDGTPAPTIGVADIQVTIKPTQAVRDLIRSIKKIDLPKRAKKRLVAKLKAAKRLFKRGRTRAALKQLDAFISAVEWQRGFDIPEEIAIILVAEADRITGCMPMKNEHEDEYEHEDEHEDRG